jgi:hypothetical protein
MHGLIRLGWSHFAIVGSGVAMVLLVCWMALMPALQELYITEFALPPIEERYGFEFGTVTFSRDNVQYELPGFVSVNPAGEIARMGVRQRDVLFMGHGHGVTVLYSALIAGLVDKPRSSRLSTRTTGAPVANENHFGQFRSLATTPRELVWYVPTRITHGWRGRRVASCRIEPPDEARLIEIGLR